MNGGGEGGRGEDVVIFNYVPIGFNLHFFSTIIVTFLSFLQLFRGV